MKQDASVIILHANDDVAIARKPVKAGECIVEKNIDVLNDIQAGHKIALRDIAENEPVKRYNQIIGFASKPIKQGEHVHIQNIKIGDFNRDYAFGSNRQVLAKAVEQRTFQGYRRANGKVATRNYIGIMANVNCSASVVKAIEDHFRGQRLADYPNVDGIVALPNYHGCGINADSYQMSLLHNVLNGYATHPNFAGMLVIGLGCESAQLKDIFAKFHLEPSKMLSYLTIQETGGSQKTIEQGIKIVQAMLDQANCFQREEIPASELVLALECGGSDGYSGISANPALGYAADLLIAQGGTAILSETPEIYGAEHLLTRRAISEEVGQKLVARIKWWENYCSRNDSSMNNNPSAGNKEGGLTTILEKSLGAIAKAGCSDLQGVYHYGETVTDRGLVFMDSPGFDPAACTGQIASGANIICFTTGRGSALGTKPVPCIKIASNNFLWQRQQEDMDINCGDIIEGKETIAEAGTRIFETILAIASGEQTKSEHYGYGSLEFIPWQPGTMM